MTQKIIIHDNKTFFRRLSKVNFKSLEDLMYIQYSNFNLKINSLKVSYSKKKAILCKNFMTKKHI